MYIYVMRFCIFDSRRKDNGETPQQATKMAAHGGRTVLAFVALFAGRIVFRFRVTYYIARSSITDER